jgi:hypothetical protein
VQSWNAGPKDIVQDHPHINGANSRALVPIPDTGNVVASAIVHTPDWHDGVGFDIHPEASSRVKHIRERDVALVTPNLALQGVNNMVSGSQFERICAHCAKQFVQMR